MTFDLPDINPNLTAAIAYRAEDDVDTLLADFGEALARAGVAVGGIVQRNSKDEAGKVCGMKVIDLMTGRSIGISQNLGPGSSACKLDAAGLAEASRAVRSAIGADLDLIIVNKFSKQEAAGRGLHNEIADAIQTGRPVLTAVPASCLEAWTEFTGDQGTILLCARHLVDDWWREVSTRQALLRDATSSHTAARRSA